ncbi:MAG: FecR family protein [Rhodospirillales bacterium]|nr:FecR family protein [Rhodospirillales bacterium]
MQINRRRLLLWTLRASAVGFASFLPSPLKAMVRPGMRSTRGTVRINGFEAQPDQIVRPGDTVSTDTQGEAIFIVGSDAYLLREDSEVSFPMQNSTVKAFSLISGKILAVFGKGKTSINTPFATIGIRGTGIYIEAYPERDYICLCYGKAVLRSKINRSAGKVLDTFHHDAPQNFYKDPNRSGGLVESAKMVNHQDEELIMLEALVGRIPLFGPNPIKMPS